MNLQTVVEKPKRTESTRLRVLPGGRQGPELSQRVKEDTVKVTPGVDRTEKENYQENPEIHYGALQNFPAPRDKGFYWPVMRY